MFRRICSDPADLRGVQKSTLPFRSLLTAALTLGLVQLPVLAAAAGPTTLGGTYSSTIVDWPKGKTGTVNLVGYDPKGVATGTIDSSGRFTVPLPDQNTVDLKLFAVSGLFLPASNFRQPEDGCVGQGTATPASAHYNYFALLASIDGGGEPIQLKLSSDTHVPAPVGRTFGVLYYFDLPTTLNGSVYCAPVADSASFKGTFPAGWSLPLGTVTAISATKVATSQYTSDPLPANITWHLYNLLSGIGLQYDRVPAGQVGVKATRVVPGLPAALAGVQVNDVVVEVDGKDITALSLGQVGDLIRGPANTPVTLGIKRGTETTIQRIKVVRAEIQAP